MTNPFLPGGPEPPSGTLCCMNVVIEKRLASFRLAPAQSHRNLTLLPLLAPDGVLRYRTLPEAMAAGELTVTEVSELGSVPRLRVAHRGALPVLLLDGEELAGAKQNRVLNTSILLRAHCEAEVPVSCTEQGRWSYLSPKFSPSGNVMAPKARARKSESVAGSLMEMACFDSDQGQVWSDIAEMHHKSGHGSPTGAMKDVYGAMEDDLRRSEAVLRRVPGQVGLAAFIHGRLAGVEALSWAGAYASVHRRLVRSYAMEALLETHPVPATTPDLPAAVHDFLHRLADAPERTFPSVGLGIDHRVDLPGVTGSALVHEGEVVHAVFLRLDGDTAAPGVLHRRSGRSRGFMG